MKALIAEYGRGYDLLREAIDGLSEEELRFKPAPDKWSIHEILVHVADAEVVGVQRMKKVLAEEKPLLTSFDQDAWANGLTYEQLDREQYLQLFKLLRESMQPILARLTPEQCERVGIHDEAGPLTFRQLLERYVNHVRDHLGQIERVKRACRER
ncbi:DinB family protein [Brevibacillus sp. SYP-B805]|uniref:DinB family protein n=1 Tax=Brevibacillus sp. SYP-B805 TaxID=1578199 RepID=UPI0013EB2A95|nr:DinB family protein [Brevibacillus sp. SYP-B805]NGQ97262.1 DinB family protein [Brevibacillus sp. SYP-B805]